MRASGPSLTIAPPATAQLAEINDVIRQSKAHWPWPEHYLSAALPLLEVSAAYVCENPCAVAMDVDGEVLAFGSLASSDGRTYLDNLWVRPDRIGTGIGGRLCDWLVNRARELGVATVWVLPDPPAEGFYLKRGFTDTGARMPSRVPGGPVFSLLKIQL